MSTGAQDNEAIRERVAALDIGKAELVCCVRVPDEGRALMKIRATRRADRPSLCALIGDRREAPAIQNDSASVLLASFVTQRDASDRCRRTPTADSARRDRPGGRRRAEVPAGDASERPDRRWPDPA